MAHFALVRHEACPHDGEWVDAGLHPHGAGASPAAATSGIATVGPGQAEPPAHAHDHCSLAACQRTPSLTEPARAAAPLPATLPPATPPRPERIAAGACVHRLAPKQSPPA